MKIRISYLAMAVTALFACASLAPAAPPKKASGKPKTTQAKAKSKAKKKAPVQARKIGKPNLAEVGLVGVKLYSTGQQLVAKFGSPYDIQGVTIGGGSASPGAGGGRAGAGPSGPGAGPVAPGAPSGGGGGAPGPTAVPMDQVDDTLFFAPPGVSAPGAASPGGGGMTGPAPMPGSSAGGSRAGGAGAGASGRIVFTRWVYQRGGSRYGFLLDKSNRVVQIEAVGLKDAKVRTKRGVGFGASFGTIIKKYGAPDAYEISGSSLVVRYLVRNKVAFRLNRLGMDKPHVVTGVVVAAGKD